MNGQPHSIQLVIFDWAGTTVDFGSRAPAAAFAGVFAANDIQVTDDEARRPMGLNKREHLTAMLREPAIAARWQRARGRAWTEQDVDTMYEAFVPLQLKAIQQNADLVPNLKVVVKQLRELDIKIGGTTGYFREAADAVACRAAEDGFQPDVNVCADDVAHGRPAPWMIYHAMEQLNVSPPAEVVKIGDTTADIKAGLAAGCWSIGVCDSSSLMGLSRSEYESLADDERVMRLNRIAMTFHDAGAHATINSINELPALVHRINQEAADHPHVLSPAHS